jgi:hypothetical protein
MENSTINDRILYIIDSQYGGNQKKFAETINYSPQVVYNIVSGRRSSPSFDVLNAIISTNDNICTQWLMTGRGDLFKSDLKSSAATDDIDYKQLYLDAKYTIEIQKKYISVIETDYNNKKKELEFCL